MIFLRSETERDRQRKSEKGLQITSSAHVWNYKGVHRSFIGFWLLSAFSFSSYSLVILSFYVLPMYLSLYFTFDLHFRLFISLLYLCNYFLFIYHFTFYLHFRLLMLLLYLFNYFLFTYSFTVIDVVYLIFLWHVTRCCSPIWVPIKIIRIFFSFIFIFFVYIYFSTKHGNKKD